MGFAEKYPKLLIMRVPLEASDNRNRLSVCWLRFQDNQCTTHHSVESMTTSDKVREAKSKETRLISTAKNRMSFSRYHSENLNSKGKSGGQVNKVYWFMRTTNGGGSSQDYRRHRSTHLESDRTLG